MAAALELESVVFNHDAAGADHDALSIRQDATHAVNVPEWRRGVSSRPDDSPAAYSIGDSAGHTLTIKASFRWSDEPPVGVAAIRAMPDRGRACVLGRVRPRLVAFDAAGASALETFKLGTVHLWDWGVGARTVIWHWEYRTHAGQGWTRFATSRHRIYSLLATPTAPWVQAPFTPANIELPWVAVLDYACWWAHGARTQDAAAAQITRAVNDLGPAVITYDCPGGGSTHYAWPSFDCTAFLDRLRGGVGNGYYVNCTDCATIVSTFANAVGCDLWQSRMGYGFGLNPMLGIGSAIWEPACGWSGFSYHEVAWEDACTSDDDVFDACLQVDGDSDPTAAPHTALLPADLQFGATGAGEYRDRLATPGGRPSCEPRPATRQRRPVA